MGKNLIYWDRCIQIVIVIVIIYNNHTYHLMLILLFNNLINSYPNKYNKQIISQPKFH